LGSLVGPVFIVAASVLILAFSFNYYSLSGILIVIIFILKYIKFFFKKIIFISAYRKK